MLGRRKRRRRLLSKEYLLYMVLMAEGKKPIRFTYHYHIHPRAIFHSHKKKMEKISEAQE